MATAYPKRPPMFAMKAIRLMVKTCLAQRIGADGVMLLTVIVSTEDAAHYRRPVDFWNEQLAPLCGFSVSKLKRVREQCVNEGWLAYQPGSKSRAATYFVSIPDYADNLDDSPTDEGHDKRVWRASEPESGLNLATQQDSSAPVNQNPDGIRTECEPESGRNVSHILPVPIPDPVPKETPLPPFGLSPDFDQLRAEAEFIAQWNKTPGVVRHSRNSLATELSRLFIDHIASDQGWLRRARDALGKFPLPFYESIKQPMRLSKFLEPETVDAIHAGTYDHAKSTNGAAADRAGARVNASTKFDEAAATTGPREV